ncbi:regulatory protein, luxR family [Flagellimonas taeanensis]|uniref:Regulatory protein, luxR family n=1 Tax=Flagellimonas taeanensis TaxID=1005926 RepID=A0A1M6Z4Y9_9FLAO|nr:helix-turn-helix transcriptional regulator [Allomuricauda taeanensis]SFC11714.1 regulatory protein, luxR family [Allomuricauda taeanensis]SHL25442.1 regulatory protein, luxR family [Allomuricauda taeanensis]
MKNNHEVVVDIWKSHSNYLAKKSVELKAVNIVDYMANLFCPGPYYYYIIDSPTLTLDLVSDSVGTLLGIEPEDFSLEKLVNAMHRDDLDFFMRCEDVVAHFLKNCIPPEQMVNYKINYCLRERISDGSYRLFLMQTLTLKTTEEGALLKVFGTHTDISHITTVNNHRLSLIGLNGAPSYLELDVFDDHLFDDFVPYTYQPSELSFTKRELEVIQWMAKGLSTGAIATELNISIQTVFTHRKNILRKSGVKNTSELIAMCIRKGYI